MSSKKLQTLYLKHGDSRSSETSIIIYQATQRQSPRGSNFQGISYLGILLKCLERTRVQTGY